MHVTFSFAFSSRYAKTRTYNFCNVVRQHTEVMVGSIIWIFWILLFPAVKEFLKNPLRTGKNIAMSLVYYFFGTQCIMETCDFLLFFVMSCVTRSSICCIFKILAAGVLL